MQSGALGVVVFVMNPALKGHPMQDIWKFLLTISDGFRDALVDVNPLPIMVIALVIGIFQPTTGGYSLKALGAVVLMVLWYIISPTFSGHAVAYPDYSRVSRVVELFVMYIFAYGMIGVLGSIKGALRFGGAKTAH
jgi:hypothetical protein